jgi:adenylate cyclase
MALEIERKFLVKADTQSWMKLASASSIRQGYLCDDVKRSVRVRIADQSAFLTIKSQTEGMSRHEFEYAIPLDDAEHLLSMSVHSIIIKTRYTLNIDGLIWEIDEFHHDNKGLIVAEVELDHVEQQISLPEWIASEVTNDPRFYNLALCQNPYNLWVKTKLET